MRGNLKARIKASPREAMLSTYDETRMRLPPGGGCPVGTGGDRVTNDLNLCRRHAAVITSGLYPSACGGEPNFMCRILPQALRASSLEDRSGLRREVAAKPSEGDRVTNALNLCRRHTAVIFVRSAPVCLRRRTKFYVPRSPSVIFDASSLPEGASLRKPRFFLS